MIPAELRPSTLVVGSDGSDEDQRVAELALEVALALDASVDLVRSTDLASADEPDEGSARVVHAAMAARVAERAEVAGQRLTHLKDLLAERAQGRIEVRSRLVEGRPHEVLRAAADATRGWIVVRARASKTVLAHTVDRVLRGASRPVLVVPDGATWKPKGAILAGIDAGELDAIVLRAAEVVATSLARRLGVVHVRAHGGEATMLRVTEHVRRLAPSVSARATLGLMHVESSIAATLADHARRVDAAMLVVGTHGRRGVGRGLLGSTAESLAHCATTPILVVR